MKKKELLILGPSIVALLACSSEIPPSSSTPSDSNDSSHSGQTIGEDRDSNAVITDDGIQNGDKKLKFELANDGGRSLSLYIGGKKAFSSNKPCSISIRTPSSGVLDTFSHRSYSKSYEAIGKGNDYLTLSGTISTENGSSFSIKDIYYVKKGSRGFVVERTVTIDTASPLDYGFSSSFSLSDATLSDDYSEFTYFIPSIIYKDTSEMRSGAIASNLDLSGSVMVKETRTGLPMSFIRNSTTGLSVSLSHLQPDIVAPELGGGGNGATDKNMKYGSIGFSITPVVGVAFSYPCSEGPNTYDYGSSWVRRYNPVQKGASHSYSLGIYGSNANNHNDAMVESFQSSFIDQRIQTKNVGMEKIYKQNIDLLDAEYRFQGLNGVYGGEPWSLTLPNATVDQGYSSQFGFVGQQAAVGYHLYRYGKENKNHEIVKKGETALNFWSSPTIFGTYFPTVWWDPSNNASGGSKRDYPAFLRCMIDGAEGLLDGVLYAASIGETKTQWLNSVKKFANNLVAKQNENGSFCRAYENNGEVCTRTDDVRYQGTSELNTPIAVRFLVKMYEFTKEEKYRQSAIAAAQYSYKTLYLEKGKYIGGTCDNPNTVDKEAAVYAMYCFDAAYRLTKDQKYLKAAEHAAVCSISWMYTYDFKVFAQSNYENINTFKDGGTMGFSFIATGHSSADNYIAYIFYQIYRLYLETDNEFYRLASLVVENASKYCTDYDGRMAFKYPALMPEATTIADFAFKSVGTWLPWSSIANIEPIINMKKTFGEYDIKSLTMSIEEQKNAIESYGVGGERTI